MAAKYIFKLTPNNKDVVINTSVLLNYGNLPSVTYPIPYKTSNTLGYVIDTDTFKFVDISTFKYDKAPYPIRMEIDTDFDDLPFYGATLSKHVSSDYRIIYKHFKVLTSHSSSYLTANEDNTYDECSFGWFESDKYNIGYFIDNFDELYYYPYYKITVRLYWSDGKAHASENVTNWSSVNNNINAYPFLLRLKAESLIKSTDTLCNRTLNLFPLSGTDTFGNLADYALNIQVPDNFTTSIRDAVNFKISATFTDPNTFISVSAYKEVVVQQRAYIGLRKGYIRVYYTDTIPLEIWSPEVTALYALSDNDEANIKVDTKSFTEYYAFCVDGTFTFNKNNYTYHNTYLENTLPLSSLLSQEIIMSDTSYIMNSSITDIPSTSVGNFEYVGVRFTNFCVNSFNDLDVEGLFTKLDNNVFSDEDANKFANRFHNCAALNNNVLYLFPINDNINLTASTDILYPISSSLGLLCTNSSTYDVSIDASYYAAYARYYLDGTTYYQVSKYEDNTTDVSYYKTTEDIDIDKSSTIQGFGDGTKENVVNYKVVNDDKGNSVLYKYCVNSLLDPSTLVPRYAVYPYMQGLVAIPLEVYDFLNLDRVPILNGEDYNIIIRDSSTGKLSIDSLLLEKLLNNTSISCKYNILTDSDNNKLTGTIPNLASKGDMVTWDYSLTADSYLSMDAVEQVEQTASMSKTRARIASLNTVYTSNNIYGSSTTYSITFTNNNNFNDISTYLRVNGVQCSLLSNYKMTSTVKPGIFIISLDEYPLDISTLIDVTVKAGYVTSFNGILLVTNDENEKHLSSYINKGKELNTEHHTSMLLRTNPKLTGNIKMVVDSSYNLYLDTFKANTILNNKLYRKYPISNDGNYPRDVKTVFNSLPINYLFGVPENALKAHKVYNDFNDQYETMYEYGAETNTDNLYSENMKILAPLHIGDDIPEYFTIFRYNDVFNKETYNNTPINDTDKFISLLSDSSVVTTFDLRTHTSIGQYLNNYKDMLTNYGECYLQFIEQDNNVNSPSYRLGNNIWKGISVKRGIIADLSESTYFGSKILNSSIVNKQELFNNYIIAGFERHNLLYPNIINLEFMFNDNDMEEYSMHRYFGLYLTANDFVKYSAILSEDNIVKKYDTAGNLYIGDTNIYNTIFTNNYKDRLFYAITNDYVNRIYNELDLTAFFNKYVKNVPEENILSLDADSLVFNNVDKSFITLHFNAPLKYGEHLKFVALNYTTKGTSYTNVGNKELHLNNELATYNIVYEIIASNDDRLRTTDNYINPYVSTQECRYSENTYFYRISFYSLNINYPSISATIEEQIKRIIACINKFDTFLSVGHHTSTGLSIISEYDEMYIQHIAAPSLDDFKYDYLKFTNITSPIFTTNKEYTDSISFMTTDTVSFINKYEQLQDEENDWIDIPTDLNINGGIWQSYVESEDPDNIKLDNISYFNPSVSYYMHALTNQSDYFENYYTAFSNYNFETLGWRYNNIVKFLKTTEFNYSYIIYDDITSILKNVTKPLIVDNNKLYNVLLEFNINTGYIRNNIIDPDYYESFTSVHLLFMFNTVKSGTIMSPYNINYSMICSTTDSLLPNNKIHLYKPKESSVAIMGITNIKDIDTTVELDRNKHMETNLSINVTAGTTILTDESDYRLLHGVTYLIVQGCLRLYLNNNMSSNILYQGTKFIITLDKTLYSSINTSGLSNVTGLYVLTDVTYNIIDRDTYLNYYYDTSIPTLYTNNYFLDINDTNNSELVYPIVPLVHCLWKSNGEYYDNNSVLDVSTLNENYEIVGSFPENVYTPSDYDTNLYVTNKIDSIVYVDNVPKTYKECILNKEILHPIKKLLMDSTNISTASVYYNSNILSLEFIFSGIKFNIKLNSKVVNSYIHLDEYSGFEAFVIIDYDLSKTNELYISYEEKFILLVNHLFYINCKYEAVNNIKNISSSKYFKGSVSYAAFNGPYNIDFNSTEIVNKDVISYKKDNIHKKLKDSINFHNLWNSIFALYDVPILDYTDDNKPQFISSFIESISEYDDYVTFGYTTYNNSIFSNETGILNDNNVVVATDGLTIKSTCSKSKSFIITKADDYNDLTNAYKLLYSLNSKLKDLALNKNDVNVNVIDSSINDNISINEDSLFDKLYYIPSTKINMKKYLTNNTKVLLSAIMNSPIYNILLNSDISDNYSNISVSKPYLNKLQEYIKYLIVHETASEKLLRYVNTFDNNVDIYIIPINSEYKLIKNTTTYNPLLFTLSIPNQVKFNYGWFTPNTNNMLEFYVDDELRDILNVDLLLSNTKVKSINSIKNYTGNKVFEDNKLYTLNHNYFIVPERSLLSSTWDLNYYRLYTTENNYSIMEGYKTGIDDKSFFGSRCMILYKPYIQLSTWNYNNANDIYTITFRNALNNITSTNVRSTLIDINITSAVYNNFVNNTTFAENWNYFNDSLSTGIKNYVNNTISAFYNINSTIEVILYAIDTDENTAINIVEEEPANFDDYYVFENYQTSFTIKNSLNWLTIIINAAAGMNLYPIIKIYKK